MPPPISSQPLRCRGDASASRGNHTRGTETTLPSVSVTESASVEHDASTASASVFSVKVRIPPLQEELRILNNHFPNIRHLVRSKPPHVGDRYRIKPKLRISPGVGDVDVRRLAPLHAEKEKPIPPDPEKSGHCPSLPRRQGLRPALAAPRRSRGRWRPRNAAAESPPITTRNVHAPP
jgi:hypothetical protein